MWIVGEVLGVKMLMRKPAVEGISGRQKMKKDDRILRSVLRLISLAILFGLKSQGKPLTYIQIGSRDFVDPAE